MRVGNGSAPEKIITRLETRLEGAASGGNIQEGDLPVQSKAAQRELLREAVAHARAFCREKGVDLDALVLLEGKPFLTRIPDVVNALVVNDTTKDAFLLNALRVDLLYRATMPDAEAVTYARLNKILRILAAQVRSVAGTSDDPSALEAVGTQVDEILEQAIAPTNYEIRDVRGDYITDLSKIDFDALRKQFETGRKNIEAEKLRGALNAKLKRMVRLNKSRLNYQSKFEQMIEEYNMGAQPVDLLFTNLVTFARELDDEDQRALRMQLTEEELAVFDLITQAGTDLSAEEEMQIKLLAQQLLAALKNGKLVLDWRKKQQARADVQITIRNALNQLPARRFPPPIVRARMSAIYQHIYDSYVGVDRNIYA